ncbi:hypothetical protein K0M31_015849 [Melipona bicolor]|uniref:Uncharacterized protein n=1 Tax=Melipona bicolor TaxID=60889 RepID=A0AA40KER6_9HYME|nr:hypothetical protein K0M31_015849 [Melipona bicolor]
MRVYVFPNQYVPKEEVVNDANDSSKFQALTVGDKVARHCYRLTYDWKAPGQASGFLSQALVEASGGRRYLLLEGHHGDLHAYVRARRRLREPEARRLFRQAARAVATCHEYGVVLRNLKLRKFVFADETNKQKICFQSRCLDMI